MKLQTTIPPRADGTVIARIDSSTSYQFAGKPLVCEVGDAAHVAFLLRTGNFIPAEGADFDEAVDLVRPPKVEEDPGYEFKTVEVGDEEPVAPESFDIAAADAEALREFIKAKTGQAPHHNTGIDKLRAIAETVAD